MTKSLNTFRDFNIANYIHDNSYYVGNNESITIDNVKELINILNGIN